MAYDKLRISFSAKSKPIYWPYDWDVDLMATALASIPWDNFDYLGMLTEPDSRGYDQYGAMKGEIFIGHVIKSGTKDPPERIELNLPGLKMRRWGPAQSLHIMELVHLVGVCSDGTVFLVGAFASKERLKQLRKYN